MGTELSPCHCVHVQIQKLFFLTLVRPPIFNHGSGFSNPRDDGNSEERDAESGGTSPSEVPLDARYFFSLKLYTLPGQRREVESNCCNGNPWKFVSVKTPPQSGSAGGGAGAGSGFCVARRLAPETHDVGCDIFPQKSFPNGLFTTVKRTGPMPRSKMLLENSHQKWHFRASLSLLSMMRSVTLPRGGTEAQRDAADDLLRKSDTAIWQEVLWNVVVSVAILRWRRLVHVEFLRCREAFMADA